MSLRATKKRRVGKSALMANKIALEKEDFTFSEAFNQFKDGGTAGNRALPKQQLYRDGVFKYGGDIEEDYERPDRLSDSIRNPMAPPDDYDKMMKLIPREMYRPGVLESKKQMSDFYIMRNLSRVDNAGRVAYTDNDQDGKPDKGTVMPPILSNLPQGVSKNEGKLLMTAENNFMQNINMFKQPRFEYANMDEQRKSIGHARHDNGAWDPDDCDSPTNGVDGGGGGGGSGGGSGAVEDDAKSLAQMIKEQADATYRASLEWLAAEQKTLEAGLHAGNRIKGKNRVERIDNSAEVKSSGHISGWFGKGEHPDHKPGYQKTDVPVIEAGPERNVKKHKTKEKLIRYGDKIATSTEVGNGAGDAEPASWSRSYNDFKEGLASIEFVEGIGSIGSSVTSSIGSFFSAGAIDPAVQEAIQFDNHRRIKNEHTESTAKPYNAELTADQLLEISERAEQENIKMQGIIERTRKYQSKPGAVVQSGSGGTNTYRKKKTRNAPKPAPVAKPASKGYLESALDLGSAGLDNLADTGRYVADNALKMENVYKMGNALKGAPGALLNVGLGLGDMYKGNYVQGGSKIFTGGFSAYEMSGDVVKLNSEYRDQNIKLQYSRWKADVQLKPAEYKDMSFEDYATLKAGLEIVPADYDMIDKARVKTAKRKAEQAAQSEAFPS